jgi:hypothetical protein
MQKSAGWKFPAEKNPQEKYKTHKKKGVLLNA